MFGKAVFVGKHMSEKKPRSGFEVWRGVAYPLGATYDGGGVNFAVWSEGATGVAVCLFNPENPQEELCSLPLADVTHHVWHGYVPGLKPGALYGFRVQGPWQPDRGLRFNAHKLLMDPYARALVGSVNHAGPLCDSNSAQGNELQMNEEDSAEFVPRCRVEDSRYDWGAETRPNIIWRRTIIYELHIEGFTARHPGVPPELRGTYLGLAHPAAIRHLLELGVTSVQLMPVHAGCTEGFLSAKGLTNYWNYNTLSFFAPDKRFASSKAPGQAVVEFKDMVKALHEAGLEVILDVVYNHTCEGNHLGPALSFRGLDNQNYYWLEPGNLARYRNYTGCGNTLKLSHPQVLKLVLDSLRYWVTEMHVDGFRFDLCSVMGRTGEGGFDAKAAFFQAVYQDPVLSRVKLIAEPWDIGPGGYRTGGFPLQWAEWNDRFRETIRRFWRGDERQAAEIGYRLTGSSDLFRASGRRPSASINYVACHDGFSLHDLVSYSRKHNELNGEENRDGTHENHSWNCGVEGETHDEKVLALRERQKRNFLATLFISQGTPMLTAGDEMGRTQKGNNNAYCQANDISWLNWELNERQTALLDFTRRCIRIRQGMPVLLRRSFFLGETLEDSRFRDLAWFRPDGHEMTHSDWQLPYVRCLGLFLGGDAIATLDPKGRKLLGDTLFILLNAHYEAVPICLPGKEWGARWDVLLDTAQEVTAERALSASEKFLLPGRSMLVLVQS